MSVLPDTLWFDAAVVLGLFAVGNVLFGHFEAHKPKWKRLLKIASTTLAVVLVTALLGRIYACAILGLLLSAAAIVHCWWLPKHGVDGWTGEPRESYLLLMGENPQAK
ncbi:MAG: hypothetical protein JNJ55_04705 [Betaproteobacteria bacterium]|nr:hypothetical protein [Betaproteobacteria bacterium]